MILDMIIDKRKIQLREEKEKTSFSEIKKRASECSRNTVSLSAALRRPYISVIAEVKKASPSKSVICENFDPVSIAREYEKAGADAISCLTENYYFQGSLSYLAKIRQNVHIPILRKDFIIDEFQIYESRAAGADAILLIAAVLDTDTLKRFKKTADECGLECIFEIHNQNELQKILPASPEIIGINNRDLKTFEVSLDNTKALCNLIRDDYIIVSESGIRNHNDMLLINNYGANAALIGETLMRCDDKFQMMRKLKEG